MNCSTCPDRLIRGYRLRPLAEIGKWEETAEVRCESTMTGAALFCAALLFDGIPYLAGDVRSAEWLQTTTTSRNPTMRRVLYRIEALLQDKISMITSPTATNRRRSTPFGIEAAPSPAATEPSARACARQGPAASEAVMSWTGSARRPSRARVLSLPGSP